MVGIARRFFVALTVLATLGLSGANFGPSTALAAVPAWQTTVTAITGDGNLTMAPGETAAVTIKFKNTGSATWKNSGDNYVSLYTYGPKYRKSVFDPGTWIWGDHLALLQDKMVAPGKTGTVSFSLHAPAKEGVYDEVFKLASEETAWVAGSDINLHIVVKKPALAAVPMAAPAVTVAPSAEIVAVSASTIVAKAGSSVWLQAAVKNTGTTTWGGVGLNQAAHIAAANEGDFTHPSWVGGHIAYVEQTVKPGEVTALSFALRAPSVAGSYTTHFGVVIDGNQEANATIDLPVEVTGAAGEVSDAPMIALPTVSYIPEPNIKVGAIIVDEEVQNQVQIVGTTSDLSLQTADGQILANIPQGQKITAYYKAGSYFYDLGAGKQNSPLPLRFVPSTNTDVLQVVNFDRRLTRSDKFADNTFRGTLELRYNDKKDRTWLINELPIELYMRGIAETSDSSPMEYQKAMLTAARTYAYFNMTHNSGNQREGFDVTAYTTDQVYRGYGQESRSPNIVEAINETAGDIITYQGDVAITPYFARSNGKTRNWSDVWGGGSDRPYNKSVPVPCDKGKTEWGHGVGMPASGALCMSNDGKSSQEIIQYFYTGVEIDKKWN